MKVAVAIITNTSHQVLITQRAANKSHGGYWEFPGGKLEANETPTQALKREIQEEVGLEVLECEFLGEVKHTYVYKEVSLLVFHVTAFVGEATCCEAQMNLRWVNIDALSQYSFPAANEHIIALIPVATEGCLSQLANG